MTIKCHFDGKVLVPDEPVSLPVNQSMNVVVEEPEFAFIDPPGGPATVGNLIDSGFIGGWSHRAEITDSVEFAHDLRRQAERRGDKR
jgi:hypothetical protein